MSLDGSDAASVTDPGTRTSRTFFHVFASRTSTLVDSLSAVAAP